MLCVDIEQMNKGAQELEDAGILLFHLTEEIEQLSKQLTAVQHKALEEQQNRLKRLVEELQEERLQLQMLKRTLEEVRQQYALTGESVLRRCETSCIARPKRVMRTVNLHAIRENMENVSFL